MKKADSMLLATFFSTCFYSATYPYICKVIMSAVTENAIAVNQIAVCISVILFSSLWNQFSDRLYPFFQLFCVLESITGVCTSVYVTVHPENVMIYYVLDTLMFCLITRNIICGGTATQIPFNWLYSESYITVMTPLENIKARDYHLAWKGVSDNSHPLIRMIKILEGV